MNAAVVGLPHCMINKRHCKAKQVDGPVMSTLYVTADELIVFMIAISVALVPMILWIGRRVSEIRLETTSAPRGANTPDTDSVGPGEGHDLTTRLIPFQSAQTIRQNALSRGSRGGRDEARMDTVTKLPKP